MDARTLVLTPWYVPLEVITWQEAVTLTYLGKAEVLITYDSEIRSPSTVIKTPAVIVLKGKLRPEKRRVKFSRVNVYSRDGFRCLYCNGRFPMSELTYDHVLPRAQGGRTEWENIATACSRCNAKKGNRTPEQAGMRPVRTPYRPYSLPFVPPQIDRRHAPHEWRDFCAAPGGAA